MSKSKKPNSQEQQSRPPLQQAQTTKEALQCPKCGSGKHEIYKTRNMPNLRRTIRYCRCLDCEARYRHLEMIRLPSVSKPTQKRQA